MIDSQHEIAALFVETNGRYFGMPNVDPWDVERDARKYEGDLPVVAHPPCFLWVNLAAVNWKRYQRQKPAWYPGGTDGGCFAAALAAVRRCGGAAVCWNISRARGRGQSTDSSGRKELAGRSTAC